MSDRTFIAVEVNDGVRGCLNSRCEKLHRHPGAITWVQPRAFHVTLNFLDAIAPARMAEVQAVVAEAAAKARPFDFQVTGLVAMPPKGRPRVIWANVIDPSGELAALQERLCVGLEGIGIPREDRLFIPHVTVARIRFTPATRAVRGDVGSLEKEDFGGVHADQVIVFTSDLQADGPVYTPVAKVALGSKGG
ncbi:MAG: RNA 2',3'-cyclic phosphodiesterase [Planctomycetota bacterium]|nr:RNA 2',3'-cyclic phosphodiesterase [Planctomycetota bacterium]